jgi:hypothetical protein
MENLLLKIGGKELYFDVEKLSDVVKIEPVKISKLDIEGMEDDEDEDEEIIIDGEVRIDISKYEVYRELINTILDYQEEVDPKMGFKGLENTPIPFKLSFNTLLMKGIIKEL